MAPENILTDGRDQKTFLFTNQVSSSSSTIAFKSNKGTSSKFNLTFTMLSIPLFGVRRLSVFFSCAFCTSSRLTISCSRLISEPVDFRNSALMLLWWREAFCSVFQRCPVVNKLVTAALVWKTLMWFDRCFESNEAHEHLAQLRVTILLYRISGLHFSRCVQISLNSKHVRV